MKAQKTVHLSSGFHSPLHSGKPTSENPLGTISLDIELQCRDSCQFYVVQAILSYFLSIFIVPSRNLNPPNWQSLHRRMVDSSKCWRC